MALMADSRIRNPDTKEKLLGGAAAVLEHRCVGGGVGVCAYGGGGGGANVKHLGAPANLPPPLPAGPSPLWWRSVPPSRGGW